MEITTSLSRAKSPFSQRFLNKTIEFVKISGIISILQTIYDMKPYEQKLANLRQMPKGTVGKEMSKMLDAHQLRLIPKYESHDLKHLLLGYGMTPKDEIKMQVFLLGNGNFTLTCLLFASLGIFMPDSWREFRAEYQKGKRSISILHLELEDCCGENFEELKKMYQL
jgi:ubiquinone biosynthesis protein Coq4